MPHRRALRIFPLVLTLLLCPATALAAGQQPVRVTLLNPAAAGHDFWDLLTRFSQKAARDLNIELEVVYGNGNRFLTSEQAQAILSREQKPDYLIFNYFFSQGVGVLEQAEKSGVRSIIINTDIPPREQAATGKPGEHFRLWTGRIIPDDRNAGAQLAAVLSAQLNGREPLPVPLIAISGMRDSSAAIFRNEGLQAHLRQHPELVLKQLVYANWSPETAASQSAALLERYPQTRFIWAASDAMALAALDSADANPGRKDRVMAVGVDWTPEGLAAIEQGRLLASAGGHFMDGALALVMIYDHAAGVHTSNQQRDIQRAMAIINRQNIGQYRQLLNPRRWDGLDFKRLTLSHDKSRNNYPFDTETVNRLLTQPEQRP